MLDIKGEAPLQVTKKCDGYLLTGSNGARYLTLWEELAYRFFGKKPVRKSRDAK